MILKPNKTAKIVSDELFLKSSTFLTKKGRQNKRKMNFYGKNVLFFIYIRA